jgi:A/G-specific adenine glycosylase
LPWRDTRDPWHVLVSEVMLQQTGVSRAMPKWSVFISEFPTALDCSQAPLGDVLRLWQGLGYPRRAKNLQAAAKVVVDQHGGVVPNTLEDLLALPGVGPYTARAVLAFAFEVDAAVVDTNIARVLARFHGRTLKARDAQKLADDWVPQGEAWLWNQALMDLGATICRPQPMCDECPLSEKCSWRGNGADPSVGSAGVSVAQAKFAGSDRQARGRLMKQLGIDRQVLAVTHLPQVAACADHHLVVSKQSDAKGTASQVSVVDADARVKEIARMLGGEKVSDTTLAHAREMLTK